MRPTTLRRGLGTALLVVTLVASLGVVVAGVAAVRLYQSQQRVTGNLYRSSVLAADLDQALLEQQAGFRGYALSADRALLADYRRAQARGQRDHQLLDRLEAGQPDLLALRERSRRQAEAWRRGVVEPAVVRIGAGETFTPQRLLSGQRRFGAARVALDAYQREVRDRRESAIGDLRANNVLLFTVIGVGVLVLLSLAAGAWWGLNRWVLRPLSTLGSEVDRVQTGDLGRAVTLSDAPEELRALADRVERMRLRIVQEYAIAEQAGREASEARLRVEEQADELRRSNIELEQFAYVASHDLQEPLRKVASFCQLLERRYKGQLDERGDRYIEFAVDGAKRMQRLINDLLAFSRVGRMSPELVPVDLGQLFDQALRQVDELATEVGARLTRDDLPTVMGDPSLLVQLFQNLLSNGMKFRRDGVAPSVHVAADLVDDEWQLTCRDNGIGVEPQYAEKIFVLFQRLHSREAYGGTGIGLAMCRKIVEHHGGRMWLDEQVTDGATFHWTMPVMSEPAQTDGRADGDEERNETDDGDATQPAGHGAARGGRPG